MTVLKNMRPRLLALLLGGVIAPGSAALAASGPGISSFVELADRLKPTVVSISVVREEIAPSIGNDPRKFFERHLGRGRKRGGLLTLQRGSRGSGFILTDDGFIVTNEHVIRKASFIRVRLADRTRLPAKIIGIDRRTDLALLKVEAGRRLPAVTLGDSDALKVGEWVLAIGNPFGLGHTVTAGIVSAKGRVIGAGPYDDFIQTDASINPGNSGGPLFNLKGEVIGVNTAIRRGSQGIGFAIPLKLVKRVVEDLKVHRRVVRAFLGVRVQAVSVAVARTFGLKKAEGALVSEVVDRSPAQEGGLRRGDVILAFGEKPVRETHDLPRMVADARVGQKVRIRIFRKRAEVTLSVVLGEALGGRQRAAGLQLRPGLGLSVRTLTPALSEKVRVKAKGGVLITHVARAAQGARAGLRKGDVILEVNQKPVKTVEEYRKALNPGNAPQVLLVQRGTSTTFVSVEPD